ncbi:hypothetical protein, partial [Marinomonas primoryensis]
PRRHPWPQTRHARRQIRPHDHRTGRPTLARARRRVTAAHVRGGQRGQLCRSQPTACLRFTRRGRRHRGRKSRCHRL